LQPHTYVETFGSFGLPGSFLTRRNYSLAKLNHLEISYCKIQTYSTNVALQPNAANKQII